eukprot:1158336-Pelagomonas_calceolata.AAC.3
MSNYSLPCSIRGAASGGEVSGEWKMTGLGLRGRIVQVGLHCYIRLQVQERDIFMRQSTGNVSLASKVDGHSSVYLCLACFDVCILDFICSSRSSLGMTLLSLPLLSFAGSKELIKS